jgi:adenylosuccinate lyase
MKFILKHLIVHEDRIAENVNSAAHLICSEALMFYIGRKLGKDRAHRLIYEAAMKAAESREKFIDLLFRNEEIEKVCSRQEICAIVNPEEHVGLSREITKNVLQGFFQRLDLAEADKERQCPLAGPDGTCSVIYHE